MKENPKIFKAMSIDTDHAKVIGGVHKNARHFMKLLDESQYLEHLYQVKQLGRIRIQTKYEFSRYEYVLLQLYFYSVLGQSGRSILKYSLGGNVSTAIIDQTLYHLDQNEIRDLSVAEVLQILCFSYNVGHFKNTFTSSFVLVEALSEDASLKSEYLKNFQHKELFDMALEIIDDFDYYSIHLLNSILLLQKLDTLEPTVKLAINLIFSYLKWRSNPQTKAIDEKIADIFGIFQATRNLVYVSIDLNISKLPIRMMLDDRDLIKDFYLSTLGAKKMKSSSFIMLKSLQDMLSDSVYNVPLNVLSNGHVSKSIRNEIGKNPKTPDLFRENYQDLILGRLPMYELFSKKVPSSNDYSCTLCLSFSLRSKIDIVSFAHILDTIEFVRASWNLNPTSKEYTIVCTLSKQCKDKAKTSFRLIRDILSLLSSRGIEEDYEMIHLELVRFFLINLFAEHAIKLTGMMADNDIVSYARGNRERVKAAESHKINIQKKHMKGEENEINTLIDVLKLDKKNDSALIVHANIEVKDPESLITKNEFDGMIIFPNRKQNQIVFIESKDKKIGKDKNEGLKALKDRMDNYNLKYDINKFRTIRSTNFFYYYSL